MKDPVEELIADSNGVEFTLRADQSVELRRGDQFISLPRSSWVGLIEQLMRVESQTPP